MKRYVYVNKNVWNILYRFWILAKKLTMILSLINNYNDHSLQKGYLWSKQKTW